MFSMRPGRPSCIWATPAPACASSISIRAWKEACSTPNGLDQAGVANRRPADVRLHVARGAGAGAIGRRRRNRAKRANKGAAPFDPNTVDFQKLKARFERANGKIDISDAVVYNPLIGMTTEGYIDFRGNAIDLSGAFIPAYA